MSVLPETNYPEFATQKFALLKYFKPQNQQVATTNITVPFLNSFLAEYVFL